MKILSLFPLVLGLSLVSPTPQPSPSATPTPPPVEEATPTPTPTPTPIPTPTLTNKRTAPQLTEQFPTTKTEIAKQEEYNRTHCFFPYAATRAWLIAFYKQSGGDPNKLIFKLLRTTPMVDGAGMLETWETWDSARNEYTDVTIAIHVNPHATN